MHWVYNSKSNGIEISQFYINAEYLIPVSVCNCSTAAVVVHFFNLVHIER